MYCSLLIALFALSNQGDRSAAKPTILSVRYGLSTVTFSGRAAGWPFRPGHWNWLTATVENPLDRDIAAVLVFYTASPQATGRFQLTKQFNVPSKSARRISFPVRKPPDLTAAASHGVLELRVDGELCDEKRATLSDLDPNIHPVAILGESEGLQSALDSKSLYPQRGPELQPQGIIRLLRLEDDQMPDNPLGLDFVQTLIIVHPTTHELRPDQWNAIDDWVQSGGNLVVILGNDLAAAEVPGLRPMLAAYPIALRSATVLPSLADWSGAELIFAEGFVLSELLVQSGRVLVWDGGAPLVVHSSRGSGTVSCIAIDVVHGLADQPAYRSFWMEILRTLHRAPVVDTARLEPATSSIVEQFAGRQVVGIWLPLVVVAAYCSIVGLFVHRARSRATGETCWPWVCVAALVLTCVTIAIGWIASPRATRDLYQLWVATGSSGSKTFRIADYLAVLPVTRGETSLRVPSRFVQVVPSPQFGASVVNSQIQHDGQSTRFLAEKAQRQMLQLDGVMSLNAPRVRARAEPDAIVLECSNERPDDIEHSFFMLGRRIVPVGRIGHGERRVVRIEPATDSAVNRYESDQIADSAGRLRRSILDMLFVDPASLSNTDMLVRIDRGHEQGTRSNWLFGGWLDRVLDVSWDDQSEPARVRSLGLLALEPEWESPHGDFLVPKGGMTLKLSDPSWRPFYYGKSVFRGNHPFVAPHEIEFAVPPWAGPSAIEQATLFVQFTGEAYRLRVMLGDQLLPLPEAPVGRFAIPLPKGEAILRNTLKLQLMVEPRDQFANDQAWQEYRWMIGEFDIECHCRSLIDDLERGLDLGTRQND